MELQTLDKLIPHDDEQPLETFITNFDWSDTTLTLFERQKVQELLVECHDLFARHRFDIGLNREFKVKLTSNDYRPAYSQSRPTPVNLKDDITVELAPLHKYVLITFLLFSKFAKPIFAQRKLNGCLRMLVDLRKINNLISEDYVDKVKNFLDILKFPKSKKGLQRYTGFLNYYRIYIPRLSERLGPFFKLLKETNKFYISNELTSNFEQLNNLNNLHLQPCQKALKQPLKNKQLILMSDASFTASGYAIMIENDPHQKLQSKRKTCAPIAFGSKSL